MFATVRHSRLSLRSFLLAVLHLSSAPFPIRYSLLAIRYSPFAIRLLSPPDEGMTERRMAQTGAACAPGRACVTARVAPVAPRTGRRSPVRGRRPASQATGCPPHGAPCGISGSGPRFILLLPPDHAAIATWGLGSRGRDPSLPTGRLPTSQRDCHSPGSAYSERLRRRPSLSPG
jgi:hypothetical protein